MLKMFLILEFFILFFVFMRRKLRSFSCFVSIQQAVSLIDVVNFQENNSNLLSLVDFFENSESFRQFFNNPTVYNSKIYWIFFSTKTRRIKKLLKYKTPFFAEKSLQQSLLPRMLSFHFEILLKNIFFCLWKAKLQSLKNDDEKEKLLKRSYDVWRE